MRLVMLGCLVAAVHRVEVENPVPDQEKSLARAAAIPWVIVVLAVPPEVSAPVHAPVPGLALGLARWVYSR